MKYTVMIREAPDGYYIASCPLVPEAHAQSRNYEECLSHMREALALCIDYRRERGEGIPDEAKSRQVVLAL